MRQQMLRANVLRLEHERTAELRLVCRKAGVWRCLIPTTPCSSSSLAPVLDAFLSQNVEVELKPGGRNIVLHGACS